MEPFTPIDFLKSGAEGARIRWIPLRRDPAPLAPDPQVEAGRDVMSPSGVAILGREKRRPQSRSLSRLGAPLKLGRVQAH